MQLIPNAWFHCTNWMLLSMHRCMPSDLVMVSREPSRDVTPRDDSSWRHTGCVSARGWVMLDDVSAFGLWRQPLLLSTLWTHAWTLGVVHNLGKTPTNECTYLLELTLPLAPRVCVPGLYPRCCWSTMSARNVGHRCRTTRAEGYNAQPRKPSKCYWCLPSNENK